MFGFRMDLPVLRGDHIQWKLIDARAVLLDIDEGIMLKLDESGTMIWLEIDGKKSGRDIALSLMGSFKVERNRVEKDVGVFLKKLLKEEAIEFVKRKG